MKFKKWIAGAAMAAMVFGIGGAALADTAPSGSNGSLVDQSQAQLGTTSGTTTVTTSGTATGTTATGTTANTQTGTAAATTTGVQAQGGSSATVPSVLPDSIWYRLKLFIQKIEILLTFDAAKKAQLLMDQAQQRLVEAQQMNAEGKQKLAAQTMVVYQQTVQQAASVIKSAARDTRDLNKLTAQIEKHHPEWARVLAQVIATVPADQQDKLAQAIGPALLEMARTGEHKGKDELKKDDKDQAENDEKNDSDENKQAQKQSPVAAALAQVSDQATAQAMLKAGLNARTVLTLDAIARQSGKTLAEVYTRYQASGNLGRLVKDLQFKQSEVEHAVNAEVSAIRTQVRGKSEKEHKASGEKSHQHDDGEKESEND